MGMYATINIGRRQARVTTAPAIFAAVLPLLASNGALAANLDYQLTAGYGHSDNIARVSTGEQEEDIASAGVRFSFDHRSPRLDADLVGDLAYYDYLDDTFDSEFLGNIAGTTRVALVPERVEWVFADNFGQVLRDPFTPATPENRENINVFTTGPELALALGSQTRLLLGARYSLTTYEDSPFDSDSVLGEVAIERSLSSSTSIALHGRGQQVRYDESFLNADYDQAEAFLRYSAAGIRTFLTLDVGYNQVDREASTETESSPLLQLELSRRISASSTINLTAGSHYANGGAAFAAAQTGGEIDLGTTPGRQSTIPFRDDYGSFGWQYQRNRNDLSLTAGYREYTYEGEPLLDQTLASIVGTAQHQLSPQMSVALNLLYETAGFDEPNRDYDDLGGGLSLSWSMSRHVVLSFTYEYVDRSSDLATTEYKENRVWLTLGWQRGMPRTNTLERPFAIDAAAPPGP
jgi:hypothetical protein